MHFELVSTQQLTGASPAGDSALTVNEEGAAGMDESLLQLQTEAAIPPPMAATDPANAAAALERGILRSFRPLEDILKFRDNRENMIIMRLITC